MSDEDTEDSGEDSAAPPRKKSRARARVMDLATPEQPLGRIATTLARIEQVEDLLAAGNAPRRTASIVGKQWGIGRRQAQEYVRAVHTRWLAEAQSEDRESKRARMRAMIMHTFHKAMDREKPVVVNVGDWQQEVEYAADPDLRAAGNMLELLCRLDGLLEQPKAAEGSGFGDAFMAAMHAYYYGRQDGAALAAANDQQVVEAEVIETEPSGG